MYIRSMQVFTNIFKITPLSAKPFQKLKYLRIQTFAKPQYSQVLYKILQIHLIF